MKETKNVTTLVIAAIVVVAIVAAAAVYIVLSEGEEEETYELFFDYEVGKYYNYEVATTATSTQDDDMETEDSSTAYSIQVTAVEDDEITLQQTGTEPIAGENVDVTLVITMSNKGEMTSWEVEDVVPPEYWEQAVAYENQSMMYMELIGLEFPEEAISIGHEWGNPIEAEVPVGLDISLLVTGEVSAHFMGEESITVEAGTFDCWRIDYSMSASGEITVDIYTLTLDLTFEGTEWLDKQNCGEVKATMSFAMNMQYDGQTMEQVSESVTELVEYGTI